MCLLVNNIESNQLEDWAMKVKINKLMPYTEQNKKLKMATVTVDQRSYYISPNSIDQKNYVGCLIQLHFICNMPDINSDYQYLRCEVRIESVDYKGTLERRGYSFDNVKRNEGKREFIFEFIPPYRGGYNIILDLAYKQRYFIQSNQPPEEKRDSLKASIACEDPFQVEQNIIYEEKPSSISFPLFVQYVVTNKLKQTLQLEMNFASEFFNHKFLNGTNYIQIAGNESYYIMLEVKQKEDKNKKQALFGEKGLMIGTLWLIQGKSKFEKKLFLMQKYKHLLFKGETIDKKVVKKDIVEVRIKFVNIYQIDYKIGEIRIGVEENEIPAGIKLLKISKDKIDLTANAEQVIVLTLICLRSGLFQLKGIVLNIKDSKATKDIAAVRILKYINQLSLIVENEKEEKKDIVMEKTAEIQIDSLI